MKFDKILLGIKLGAAVAKSIATGKPAKVLDKVDEAAGIAKAVKKLLSRNDK